MVYRYNLNQDPRFRRVLTVSAVGGVAVLLGAVFALQRGSVITAVAIVAISGFLGYRLAVYLRGHKRSYVETLDDHLRVRTPTGSIVTFEWDSLSSFGLAKLSDGDEFLYAYSHSLDRFFSIPESFDNRSHLIEELSEKCERRDLTVEKDESMSDAIRRSLSALEEKER